MDVEELLRGNFADRADRVAPPRPDLLEAVVAGHSRERRRRAGLAAGLLGLALVAVGVPVIRGVSPEAPPSSADSALSAAGADLADLPTRGSLAGNAAAVDLIRRLSWNTGAPADPGPPVDPPVAVRHVLFAGVVPGGQVWALVQGTVMDRRYYAWFGDPDPGDGLSMTLLRGPVDADAGGATALMDVAGASGPLVVVAAPGEDVTVTTPPGSGRMRPLADGVVAGMVGTPDDGAPVDVAIRQDGTLTASLPALHFDSSSPPRSSALSAVTDLYVANMSACLASRGYTVTWQGSAFSYAAGPTTADQDEAFGAAVHGCATELGYE